MSGVLRVALGEYDTGWHDAPVSLERAASVVQQAARSGAALVALPEMCTTGFTMDASRQGEPLDGASGRALGRIAAASGVHLLAGIALRECVGGEERATNAAVLFDEGGTVRNVYRKQRVFGYAGEDDVYTPGGRAQIATLQGVRIAPFICYDLRFPELFRQVARDVDAIVVIANWPASRRAHWDALLRARAIENQCYVIGVNRIGEGNGIPYDGGSAAFDPWGLPLGAGIVSVDAERVRALRAEYPFLRDYGG